MTDDKRTDHDAKTDPKKNGGKAAPENLTPTPTQEENDELKAKMHGVKVEKRETKDVPEVLPPTPTQAENDQTKLAAMYVHVPPEGSTDPQKTEPQAHRRSIEANRPGGYETRATAAAPAKVE